MAVPIDEAGRTLAEAVAASAKSSRGGRRQGRDSLRAFLILNSQLYESMTVIWRDHGFSSPSLLEPAACDSGATSRFQRTRLECLLQQKIVADSNPFLPWL